MYCDASQLNNNDIKGIRNTTIMCVKLFYLEDEGSSDGTVHTNHSTLSHGSRCLHVHRLCVLILLNLHSVPQEAVMMQRTYMQQWDLADGSTNTHRHQQLGQYSD